MYDAFVLKNPFIFINLFQHFQTYSVGIDFIRQNLASVDVRFCRRTKVDPLTVKVRIFLMTVDP